MPVRFEDIYNEMRCKLGITVNNTGHMGHMSTSITLCLRLCPHLNGITTVNTNVSDDVGGNV